MALRNKERVVAEAALAGFRGEKVSFHDPVEEGVDAPLPGEGEHALEAGGALFGVGETREFAQEFLAVVGVGGVGTGVACRKNARSPVECIHTEAGVVSEHPVVEAVGGQESLQGSVFGEGGPGLFGGRNFGVGAKVGQDPFRSQKGPDFAGFVGVFGRDEQGRHFLR